MKRLLLTSLLSLLVVPMALATTNYINNGIVSVISPPQIAPQIDASNFVNNGTFSIINVYSTSFQPPLPYESWNTRNWTNANLMTGDSGFRFDYFDSVGGTNGWSANFQNAGNANPTNANIFGTSYLLVSATNINNKGTMAVSGPGLMTLNGANIDLTRGTLGAVGNESNNLAGVLDLYWGVGTNFLSASFAPFSVASSPMPVTTIQNNQYVTIFQDLQLPAGFTTYVSIITNLFGTNMQIDVLFLRQTNSAITTEVRFGNNNGPGVEKIVQWQALLTNRVTGAVLTNQLYLDDTFAYWFTPAVLVQTLKPDIYYTLFAAATYHPYNYTITRAAPPGYAADTLMTPTALNPAIFNGTVFPTEVTNAGYAATLTASAFNPDPTIQGSTYTNVPGRIEITAAGPNSYLNLTRTLVNGESYLLLNSTNHFVGSTNAVIVSPISDFYLASTNGTMAVSNLTTPFVPRIVGEIQVWSGRWTNIMLVGTNLFDTYYNVTMIDSALDPQAPSQIQNLSLRSTNLLIGDSLNVFGSLLLDTLNLTISTNAGNAPTPYGELNLTSGDLWWSASLPRLQCLTNFGEISSVNSIYFAGARTPPWFSGTFDEPYLSFVTHGIISSVGCSIWADYFEASGTNNTGIGPLSVQAGSAIATNGLFLATDADITLTCGSLLISNQVLQAGRSITLTVTSDLDDGSLSNSIDSIANQNAWTVGNGLNLLQLPSQASLLATSVTNNAFPNTEAGIYWAGQDLGPAAAGYGSTNAPLGRLILDGGLNSSFLITGPTPTNALYVDYLEFRDYMTNFDGSGNLANLSFGPGMKIYYAQLIINGLSWAEKLNHKNGGGLNWVSAYAGAFSSTNMVYPDGTTNRLNLALVQSCDIASNPEGIANCASPTPVFVPSQVGLAAVLTNTSLTVVASNAVVLSWNSVPYAMNYVFFESSVTAANWGQPLTNFVSGPAGGRQWVVEPVPKGAGAGFYRVQVDLAAP